MSASQLTTFTPGDEILIRVTGGIVPAIVVTQTAKSLWMRLPSGGVIQRSKRKHVVTPK